MKRSSFGFLSLVVLAALTVVSCSKGKDGATGPAGKDGAAGATGAPGSANVIYSDWTNVSYTYFEDDGAGDTVWQGGIKAAKLVDSIVQKGAVMVYLNEGNADQPQIVALPSTDLLYGYYCSVYIEDQAIYFLSNFDLSSGTGSDGETYFQYRYILIPGGIAGRSLINWKDYNAVKKYLGLKN